MNVGQWMKSKKMKIPILNDAGNDKWLSWKKEIKAWLQR